MRLSRADGPRCLERTGVPVLSVTYSADPVVFPSQVGEYSAAARGRCTQYTLEGATHHLHGQPELLERLADILVDWGRAR
jgi:pimeloyl-ACP methyl ester carboxylesterase